MATLMPGAETAPRLVDVAPSKLGLEIDGVVLHDRTGRMEFLKSRAGLRVDVVKLEDLLPARQGVKKRIEEAQLVVVTSQEIDALCEGDNVPLARRAMDDVLRQLRRAFHVLADLGIEAIVVTADHGYLFGDELESGMKIDPPGGATADLHRRVWVGRGGAANPAYMRAPASAFGLGGDLEIAVPWGFGCFKVPGGASAYFHGGLAPQEIVVPLAVLRARAKTAAPGKGISWELVPGSKRISTRFFSVQVRGQVTDLFETAPPRVRAEALVGGALLSRPVSASYGFEEATGDVQLRLVAGDERVVESNTIALMIEGDVQHGNATVRLVEAGTGTLLARVGPIPLEILL